MREVYTSMKRYGNTKNSCGGWKRAELGFTLIEVLVVIGVIAILAAILLPVIASVQKKAAVTGSVANLKSLGQAFSLYTNEHGGKIFEYHQVAGGDQVWHLELFPYVGEDEAVFRSPGDPSDPEQVERTYKMNASNGFQPGFGARNGLSLFGKRMAQIPRPESTILFLDISYTGTSEIPFEGSGFATWWNDGNGDRVDSRDVYVRTFEEDKQLVVFMDGHVENLDVPYNPNFLNFEVPLN